MTVLDVMLVALWDNVLYVLACFVTFGYVRYFINFVVQRAWISYW